MPRARLSLLVLCIAAPAFAADLTIISKVTHDGGPPQTATSYIASDHLRLSQPDGNEAIIDPRAGSMTMLDGKKKTYSVITREDMEAMAKKIQEQMNSPEAKKAQEQMKNLPPEAQQRMQSMMGGMFAFDVQKSGSTRKIAGYTCENWTITMGQISRTEECLTSELKFPVRSWDMYRSYADTMQSLMSAMGPMAKNLKKMQEQMKKLKGFPLATSTSVNVMGRKSVSTSEVTSIREGPIPASAWEIPAGYTKVDSPMARALRK